MKCIQLRMQPEGTKIGSYLEDRLDKTQKWVAQDLLKRAAKMDLTKDKALRLYWENKVHMSQVVAGYKVPILSITKECEGIDEPTVDIKFH